jgi:hypothetical protein
MIESRTMVRWDMLHGRRTRKNKVWVGKPEEKRKLGRPVLRWEDNAKMDLKNKGWEGMNSIQLALDKVQWLTIVNTMNIRILWNDTNFIID